MLVCIDVDAAKVVEQGEGYMVVELNDVEYTRFRYACKIRTAKGNDPKVFNNGDPNDQIKRAKAIYVGINGGVSME